MKKHTIMGIFAHPDDETFGPGGTLIKYAALGYKTAVLTATSGQAGQAAGMSIETTVGDVRAVEAKKAASILGITDHRLLHFYDGTLNEAQIPVLQDFIMQAVEEIQPDVIIIYEREGISLHLDHIAVSKAVVKLYDEKRITPKKLYYFGLPAEMMKTFGNEGGLPERNRAIIDVSEHLETKKKAMMAHVSQMKDVKRMFERLETAKKSGITYGNHEYFSLARTTLQGLEFPETDLFTGLE